MYAERKRLRKLATLLSAIRAHARGNVHASANLAEQKRFIDAQLHLIEPGGLGTATLTKMVRLEFVLAPDDAVEVEGVFRKAPQPPELVAAQGYRERPTCWALVGGEGHPAKLVGVGVIAPRQNESAPLETESPIAEVRTAYPPPHRDPIVQSTAAAVMTVIIYYLLFF